VLRSHLEHDSLPWANAALSGFVLDPDRKKMSKSKGNVVTPAGMLKEFGSDGVRYWAASVRPGGDPAFNPNDPGEIKVGRRLAIKILNAARFALMQADPRGPITEPLDRAMLMALADLVTSSTNDFEDYDYAGALADTEKFLWGFCDDYLELVKSRRYGDFEREGAASANSAMLVALSTVMKLFAPFLPFVTEEVWSWWHSDSVHHSRWPTREEVLEAAGGHDVKVLAIREATEGALAEVRKIKSLQKKPTKAVVTKALIPAEFGDLAQRDFMAATHIRELEFVEQLAAFHLEFAEEPAA